MERTETHDTDRLLIIGWDGADWEIVDDLIERGHLPNVAKMRDSGAWGGLRSTIPSHSWAAWSTFLTGVNCGKHGVYDFVDRRPGEIGNEVPVSSDSIRATTFLEHLSGAGHEVRVANVPVTFPPIPVNGRVIAGVAVPPGARFVHPPEWAAELERRAPFPLNGMEWSRYERDPAALVEEARAFVQRRADSFEVLLEGDWSVAVCVFVAPDRLQHPLGAYLLPSHPRFGELSDTPLAHAIRGVYSLLDAQTARLRDAAGPRATTVVMSDHGFRPVDRVASLTRILSTLGLAAPSRGAVPRARLSRAASAVRSAARKVPVLDRRLDGKIGSAIRRRLRPSRELDWSKTVAYQSVRGGGISINVEGRESAGIVPRHEFDRVRGDVRDALVAYEDPATGERLVESVLLGEQLYSGPHSDLGPDLLVLPRPLWAFTYTDAASGPTTWPTGAHRQQGILVASGGRTARGHLDDHDIADVAATAMAFCGISPKDLDGRPIPAIAGVAAEATTTLQDGLQTTRSPADLSNDEQEQIAEHLRNLGYLE